MLPILGKMLHRLWDPVGGHRPIGVTNAYATAARMAGAGVYSTWAHDLVQKMMAHGMWLPNKGNKHRTHCQLWWPLGT